MSSEYRGKQTSLRKQGKQALFSHITMSVTVREVDFSSLHGEIAINYCPVPSLQDRATTSSKLNGKNS